MGKATLKFCLILAALSTASAAFGGGRFYLADGTPIKLRLMETMSSATAQVNQNVNFQVIESVNLNGTSVIPKGATAIGTVTAAQPKRRLGRGGKLNITIDYVRLADGEKAALRAVKDLKGGGHTGAMTAGIVATGLIVWPAAPFFLFMHGKDISIPEGTEITAFVNGDMDLDPQKFGSGSAANGVISARSAPAPQSLSSVTVVSTPSGGDITVDGKYVGSTPSKLELLPGNHLILIQKIGYTTWQRSIEITPGEQVTVGASLENKASSAQ
ncbi:MAG: PEGA domain-containing protein [Terriglobia bacterium]